MTTTLTTTFEAGDRVIIHVQGGYGEDQVSVALEGKRGIVEHPKVTAVGKVFGLPDGLAPAPLAVVRLNNGEVFALPPEWLEPQVIRVGKEIDPTERQS